MKTRQPSLRQRLLPVLSVLACVLLLWYGGAVALNRAGAIERVLPNLPKSSHPNGDWTFSDLVATTLNMERPVLPAPHQVAADLASSLLDWPLDSPRNLLYHVAVTAQSTLVGFALGALLGVLLVDSSTGLAAGVALQWCLAPVD